MISGELSATHDSVMAALDSQLQVAETSGGEKRDDVWLRAQLSWPPPYKVRSVVASSQTITRSRLEEELQYTTWSDKNNS
ncbi:hypothetical protein E2C01_063560 [Portunus trituberculatus]|uniref:Uncharacterized protein n=1 Tax=Portunus trituberculatus TaxID=210409 RepID=A0A5B7HKT5_PORTR|nr:hypothetical protein [Portunus trituberculatus]